MVHIDVTTGRTGLTGWGPAACRADAPAAVDAERLAAARAVLSAARAALVPA